MKRILYTILLAIGTLSFSSCTDYINVDKYFYDQVSLDSAFSKRVYVDGWLSSAYSVMDYIGEYREPFRWASGHIAGYRYIVILVMYRLYQCGQILL